MKFNFVFLFILVFYQCLLLTAEQHNGWYNITAEYSNQVMNDIICFENSIVTVGNLGTIKLSSNNGNTWNIVSGHYSSSDLNAITKSDNILYSCGNNGYLVRSSDKGNSWEPIKFDLEIDLTDIEFINSKGIMISSNGNLFHSHNNGYNWEEINFSSKNGLLDIEFLNDSIAFAIGLNGTVLKLNINQLTVNKINININEHLNCISIFKNKILIGGDNHTLIRSYNGLATWEFVPKDSIIKTFHSIKIVNDSLIFAGVSSTPELIINSQIISTDFGSSWKISSKNGIETNAFFVLDHYAYVTGKNGNVARLNLNTLNNISNFYFFDEYLLQNSASKSILNFGLYNKDNFLINKHNKIFFTSNNGYSFKSILELKYGVNEIRKIGFLGKNKIYTIYDSTHYYKVNNKLKDSLFTIMLIKNIFDRSTIKHFLPYTPTNTQNLAIADNMLILTKLPKYILISRNQGINWTKDSIEKQISANSLSLKNQGIFFAGYDINNPKDLYSYISNDNGISWDINKLNISNYIHTTFANESIGWAILSNESNKDQPLLKTVDGGKNWFVNNVFKRQTKEKFCDIKFINNKIGFITTSKSSIILTNDGGISWKEEKFDDIDYNSRVNIYFDGSNGIYLSTKKGIFKKTFNNIGSSVLQNQEPSYKNLMIKNNLPIKLDNSPTTIVIYDLLGRKKETIHVNRKKKLINMSHYQKGTYLIVIKYQNKITGNIIVNKI